jgi:hypothetical protein
MSPEFLAAGVPLVSTADCRRGALLRGAGARRNRLDRGGHGRAAEHLLAWPRSEWLDRVDSSLYGSLVGPYMAAMHDLMREKFAAPPAVCADGSEAVAHV